MFKSSAHFLQSKFPQPSEKSRQHHNQKQHSNFLICFQFYFSVQIIRVSHSFYFANLYDSFTSPTFSTNHNPIIPNFYSNHFFKLIFKF